MKAKDETTELGEINRLDHGPDRVTVAVTPDGSELKTVVVPSFLDGSPRRIVQRFDTDPVEGVDEVSPGDIILSVGRMGRADTIDLSDVKIMAVTSVEKRDNGKNVSYKLFKPDRTLSNPEGAGWEVVLRTSPADSIAGHYTDRLYYKLG